MDPMNGHFSPIKGLKSVNGIQFSLCGIPPNLIFADRGMSVTHGPFREFRWAIFPNQTSYKETPMYFYYR